MPFTSFKGPRPSSQDFNFPALRAQDSPEQDISIISLDGTSIGAFSWIRPGSATLLLETLGGWMTIHTVDGIGVRVEGPRKVTTDPEGNILIEGAA